MRSEDHIQAAITIIRGWSRKERTGYWCIIEQAKPQEEIH